MFAMSTKASAFCVGEFQVEKRHLASPGGDVRRKSNDRLSSIKRRLHELAHTPPRDCRIRLFIEPVRFSHGASTSQQAELCFSGWWGRTVARGRIRDARLLQTIKNSVTRRRRCWWLSGANRHKLGNN